MKYLNNNYFITYSKKFWLLILFVLVVIIALLDMLIFGFNLGLIAFLFTWRFIPYIILEVFFDNVYSNQLILACSIIFYIIEILLIILFFKSNNPKKYITASIIFILQIIISAIMAAVITAAYAS